MATLVTIGEIIKKFRTEGACIKFSPKTILHMADVIGYHKQRIGGKVGYEKSLITAISQRIREAIEYENSLKEKKPQRASKQPQTKPRELDYVGYNGERDNVDYEWEKNENRKMKRININESQLHLINEINHLAEKSNVTICSLEDFKSLVSSMGISDGNVEQYVGQYCFIEIGSSYPRIYTEMQFSNVNIVNGKEYTPKEFYKVGQWYFTNEHTNVIKLEFDDNQRTSLGVKKPQSSKDPRWKKDNKITNATAVALRKDEMKPEVWDALNQKSLMTRKKPYEGKKTFYYTHAKGITEELIGRIKEFVDRNLSINPNVKFVIHCRAGQSRSAALGVYLAKKVGQYTEDFLSEYGDQIKLPIKKANGDRSGRYPHQDLLNDLSRAEGWQDLSGKRQATKAAERWWYPEMMNYLEKNGK